MEVTTTNVVITIIIGGILWLCFMYKGCRRILIVWPGKIIFWFLKFFGGTTVEIFMSLTCLKRQPWTLDPYQFYAWYDREVLAGLAEFERDCNRAIDEVTFYINQNTEFSIKEVITGGALGKGTTLKGVANIDCVLLLNPPHMPFLRDVDEFPVYVENHLRRILDTMNQSLSSHPLIASRYTTQYNLVVVFKVPGRSITINLHPSADNWLREGPLIYAFMILCGSEALMLYLSSLVKLQVDFVKQKPAAVKDLIRLVKYLNKTTVAVESSRPCLPTSYQFELITIYAWERAGRPHSFDRLKGFKDVLMILSEELHDIRYFWTINYDSGTALRGIRVAEKQCRHKRPLILDPANPINNACALDWPLYNVWNFVGRIAQKTIDQSNLLSSIQVRGGWQQ